MKFSVKTVAPHRQVRSVVNLATLLDAAEAVNQSYINLTDAQRELDDVQEITNNINTATHLLNKFGDGALQLLNLDGGLESLLGIPAKLITVSKAQEGLADAAKEGVEKIKNWIKKVTEYIVAFASKVAEWIKRFVAYVGERANAIKAALSKMTEEAFVKLAKSISVNKKSATENLDIDLYYEKSRVMSVSDFRGFADTLVDAIREVRSQLSRSSSITPKDVADALNSSDPAVLDEKLEYAQAKLARNTSKRAADLNRLSEFVKNLKEPKGDATLYDQGYTSRSKVAEVLRMHGSCVERINELTKLLKDFSDSTRNLCREIITRLDANDPYYQKKKQSITVEFKLVCLNLQDPRMLASQAGTILTHQMNGLLWVIRHIPTDSK